jgi:hypothetical protein
MANLTISSPGVQIVETDISQNVTVATPPTTVLLAGFAQQGPVDEINAVTTISDFESLYGTPQNAAERYFYYTAKEILNSPASLITTRLPYGSGNGSAFASQYSALLYPAVSSSGSVAFGAPVQITFGEADYNNIIQGNITWSSVSAVATVPNTSAFPVATANGAFNGSTGALVLSAGLIIINKAQVINNEFFEGYYTALVDNTTYGPNLNFTAVSNLVGLTANSGFYTVPSTRLGFNLSADYAQVGANSVSEAIERSILFNYGDSYFNDSLALCLFKVRGSINEPQTLNINLVESYVGSLDFDKKIANTTGGAPRSFFLQNIVNNASNNILAYVNPSISVSTNWTSVSSTTPQIAARISSNSNALYPAGVWQPTYNISTTNSKDIGDVSAKLTRVLQLVESPDETPLDVVVDAGLSTIYAVTSGSGVFDSNTYVDVSSITTANSTSGNLATRYTTIANIFNNFVTNTRKDCVAILDPLRHIFINGKDAKTLTIRGTNFSNNIYNPLKNTLGAVNSNYCVTYGNWLKINDIYSHNQIWIPASGYAAAVYARTDANTQPWYAPAGLNRGTLHNIVDIAFNPNQRQRDYLYSISVNPIVYFNSDGYNIFGQKTLQLKPSAFDRVNVRRLFLALEKSVQKVVKYFVFEPNTDFTRTRLVNTITPIFDLAKNTQGLYDYLIVCDNRNNTPTTIDANQLIVDIYIKPVRAAEFILVNFVATRTSQDFSELI